MSNSSKVNSVIIIGGGLGGLTLCQALTAAKINATVYERDVDPGAREQGYYIGINEDGAKCLSMLNHPELGNLLAEHEADGFAVLDNNLKLLAEIPWDKPLKSVQTVRPGLVNRVILREALTHGIEDRIVWNKRFSRYEESGDKVKVFFEDGTSVEGDFMVGADGANSRVRQQRCPDLKTEKLNISSYAANVRAPDESKIPILSKYLQNNMIRVLGPGNGHTLLLGKITIKGEARVFWAMSHPTDGSDTVTDDTALKKIYQQKGDQFNREVQALVRMESETVMFRELSVVKPLPYNPLKPSSRVTLLGDAAHAMTTHRGLGANTALRDAVELAEAIKNGKLAEYENSLIDRGFKAVKESQQSTNSIHATGFFAKITWCFFYLFGTFFWLRKLFSRKSVDVNKKNN